MGDVGKSGPEEKAYKIIDKLESVGAKLGVVTNRRVTRFGLIIAAVATVLTFGSVALFRAFFKHVAKKS